MRRTLLLATLLLTANVQTPAADAAAARMVVYRGATLLDGTHADAKPDSVVVTRGDRIVAVMRAAEFHAQGTEEIIDVTGKFIVPGLINTHVHVATVADPAAARDYLRRELYSGVTAVRDMAGDVRLLAELKREAEFGEIPSPDIYFVALLAGPSFFTDPRTHDSARGRTAGAVPWMQAVTARTDLKQAVAQAKGTGASALKLYADLSPELVKAIAREAHRQDMRVWAHAAVFPAMPADVANAGVDVMSHACLLGYQVSVPRMRGYENKIAVDEKRVREHAGEMHALYETLKRSGVILDATLFPYENGSPLGTCPAGMEDFLAAAAYRAGVPLSTGTDDDFDGKVGYSALDTEFELLVERVGMTPADVIEAATRIGARAAGIERDCGTIEAGKLADLVVLDKDPLSDISNMRSVLWVVKHGTRFTRSDYSP